MEKALGLANYQLVPLPNELLDELETLRKKWGFWKIDDVIAKFLDIYRGGACGDISTISSHFL